MTHPFESELPAAAAALNSPSVWTISQSSIPTRGLRRARRGVDDVPTDVVSTCRGARRRSSVTHDLVGALAEAAATTIPRRPRENQAAKFCIVVATEV